MSTTTTQQDKILECLSMLNKNALLLEPRETFDRCVVGLEWGARANYQIFNRITNPSAQPATWLGKPHFLCPICFHREAAEAGEFAALKGGAGKAPQNMRRSRTGGAVPLTEAVAVAVAL
jgi:hypothetical protein